MSLEASTLTVKVLSDGIQDTTEALNDLAKAGEAAEQKTSNIGKGAKDSAKAQVDAAQQAASAYNAIIDMMTEKSNEFYANKAMKAAMASQQEIFDGMALADKLTALIQQSQADRAAMREKESADIRAKQQEQMDAAQAWYASQQEMANRMNAAFDKKQDASAKIAAMKQEEAEWKALTKAADEYYASEKKLAADADKFWNNQAKAKAAQDSQRLADAEKALRQETERLAAAEAAQHNEALKMNADATNFINTLKRQAETVGMNHQQLRDYNAEQLRAQAATLGVSNAVEGHIQKLQQAKGPHESFNLLTAGSARELMVLGHELSQGQFQRFGGSLIVLGERINFLPSLLEKAAAAANALGMSLGVFVSIIAGVVATVALAIYAFQKSTSALHDMRNAVVLTGDSIGASGDKLYDMSNKIGDAFGSFGKARTAVLELANTGRFTADQINLIAEAAVGLEKYGGVAIDKTIKQFEKLAAEPLRATDKSFKGVSNSAMDLNTQLHFLEPAVLAEIMHLERIGDVAGASKVAISALAEEEKRRVEELKGNLTELGKIMSGIGSIASKMWNSLFNKESDQDELDRVVARINDALKRIGKTGGSDTQNEQLNVWLQQSNEIQDRITQRESKAQSAMTKQKKDDEANLALVQLRNIQERAKGEENLSAAKARYEKTLTEARERAKTDAKFADNAKDFISPEAEKEALAYIERTHALKAKQPKSDGLSSLDQHLAETNAKYEIDKRYYDNQIKFINDLQQKHLISDSAADHAKKEFAENESKLEEKSLRDQLALIDDFHSKDTKLMEQAASKRADITKRLEKNMADTAAMKDRSATDPAAREQKEQDKADAETSQFLKQVNSQTEALQAKIDAYNRLPEAARASITNEKQMQDEFTKAEIEWKQQQIDAITAMGEGSAEEVIRLTAEKKALEDRARAQAKWEEVQGKITANAGRSSALTKVATEQVRMWKDLGSEIEKSLKNAFGNAGEAAGKMFKAFSEGQADQISLMNQARLISENKSLSETEKEKQLNDIRLQGAQNQVGMYGDMAGAASMFFEKGSTGYQAMAKAAQVLHAAEVALSLIKGVNAILTQGSGDPYSAFARMAAMAAIVAGLGVAISGSFGGGGSFSSADQQKIQGTGTVLGSPTITDGTKVILVGEKSNSIANSLKIAEKNSGLGLVVQNDMLTALQQLNNNISNFAAEIVKSTNISNPTVNLNKNNGFATTLMGAIGGGVLGLIASKIPVLNNIVGKIATSIFGGKQSLDDSGLTLGKTNLGNVMTSGVDAKSYANITTSGGWFRSDKHSTQLSSLGADTNDQFTKVILSMSDTLKMAAKGLGMDTNAFNDKLKSFVIDIGNVSFKGMTGDEIQKTLQNVFSKLGDQMAQYAFADLQKYQKVGEGLMETVVRVANDLMQVNDVFKVLGKTMPAAAAGIAQAEKLVDSFGSSDALSKAVKSYEDAIYTDNEKLAPVVASVQDALKSMGLSSIKTKEDFKLVVDSLDLTSDAGVSMFNKLMNIAPTFGTAIDGLSKVNDTTKSSLQSVIDKLKQFSDGIRSFRDGLVLGANSTLTPAQKLAEAASQFENTLTKAKAGDSTAQGNVTNIAQSYLDAARTMFASGDAYTKVFNQVEAELAKVQDFADKGVSDTQKQLDTMTNQLTSLNTLNGTATDILNSLNNLVSGTSPATTATGGNSTNAELLQVLKSLEGTLQQSDANNSAGLNNVAAATYDGQQTAAETISDGISTAITLLKKSGALYNVVER